MIAATSPATVSPKPRRRSGSHKPKRRDFTHLNDELLGDLADLLGPHGALATVIIRTALADARKGDAQACAFFRTAHFQNLALALGLTPSDILGRLN